MKKDEPFDPAYVSTLGAKSIVFQTHDIAHLIKQFARFFCNYKIFVFSLKLCYIKFFAETTQIYRVVLHNVP